MFGAPEAWGPGPGPLGLLSKTALAIIEEFLSSSLAGQKFVAGARLEGNIVGIGKPTFSSSGYQYYLGYEHIIIYECWYV